MVRRFELRNFWSLDRIVKQRCAVTSLYGFVLVEWPSEYTDVAVDAARLIRACRRRRSRRV